MKDRIKELRKTLHLTLAEFADRIGVTNPSVSYWEHGRTIPESRIKSICQIFNVNEDWLRIGKGEMFEPEKAPKSPEELRLEVARGFLRECSDDFKRALVVALKEDSIY